MSTTDSKAKQQATLLFQLYGFEVHQNSVYVIKDKPDPDAPSGFQQVRATKLPSAGIDETFHCPYNSQSSIWDTGLYEDSPCFVNDPREVAKAKAALHTKSVLKPFMQAKGYSDSTLFRQNNNEFWDNYRVRVGRDRIFDTSKPDDVFDLYLALLARKVAPEHDKSNPLFRNTSYLVVDQNKNLRVKEETTRKTHECRRAFYQLLGEDLRVMKALLHYMGTRLSDSADETTVMMVFDEQIATNIVKVEQFNILYAEMNNPQSQFKDELFVFKALKSPAFKKHLKTDAGLIYFDGDVVGPDLKSASRNIARNPELTDLKDKILIPDED